MPRRADPEHAFQASVARFLTEHLPPEMPWTAVDTVQLRGDDIQRINAWNRLKARGIKKGVHDLPLIYWRGKLLSLELKAGKNQPTDEQDKWGIKITAQGGHVAYCWTRRQVLDAFEAAFGDDNPLRSVPPALVQIWLAHDDAPPKVKKARKASKPRQAKPSRRAVAVAERFREIMK